jgi:hypothetical protein
MVMGLSDDWDGMFIQFPLLRYVSLHSISLRSTGASSITEGQSKKHHVISQQLKFTICSFQQ